MRRRTFGTVFRRKSRDGTTLPGYYVRWSEGGRRITRGSFPTTAKAEAFLATRHAALSRGAKTHSGVTFDALIPIVLRAKRATLVPSSYDREEKYLSSIARDWRGRSIEAVTRGEVQQWVEHLRLERGYAPATVRLWHAVLSGAYTVAVELDLVEGNPCRGVRLPRVPKKPIPYLDDADIDRFLARCDETMRPFATILFDAGLRRAEAEGLTWRDVAADHGSITVRGKGGKARIVPTTARAAKVLEELRNRAVTPLRGAAHVFGDDLRRRGLVTYRWRVAGEAAGLGHQHPHVARHAFAVRLVRRGVDLPTVARLLGHASLKVTMRYADHAPADARVQAIRTLDGHGATLRRKAGPGSA